MEVHCAEELTDNARIVRLFKTSKVQQIHLDESFSHIAEISGGVHLKEWPVETLRLHIEAHLHVILGIIEISPHSSLTLGPKTLIFPPIGSLGETIRILHAQASSKHQDPHHPCYAEVHLHRRQYPCPSSCWQ